MISQLRETLAAFGHRLSWAEPFDWDEDDESFVPDLDLADVSTDQCVSEGRQRGAKLLGADG